MTVCRDVPARSRYPQQAMDGGTSRGGAVAPIHPNHGTGRRRSNPKTRSPRQGNYPESEPPPGHKCRGYERRRMNPALSPLQGALFIALAFMPGRGRRNDDKNHRLVLSGWYYQKAEGALSLLKETRDHWQAIGPLLTIRDEHDY